MVTAAPLKRAEERLQSLGMMVARDCFWAELALRVSACNNADLISRGRSIRSDMKKARLIQNRKALKTK
ncbi:MAG: hypothetical protein DMG65_22025 [Candidatus Angelobacter sp. Gp1-AA117]|nr:MAG: hypothetical protein DMG65_22025 [Candidatus Angelobacter sp. Gp1-AA117]